MAPVQYRALEPISRGVYPSVPAGELVDASLTLLSSVGQEEAVDLERLLELGVIEAASAPREPAPAPQKTEEPAKPAKARRSRAKS